MSSGTILGGFLYGPLPGLSSNVPGDHAPPLGERGLVDLLPAQSGVITNNQPIAIRSLEKIGVVARTFRDDWYNRIHIFPRILDFGAVGGGAARDVFVWNAYFTSATLNGVSVDIDGNVAVSGLVFPFTFKALDYRPLTFTVAADGPEVIDSHYTFDFDPLPDIVILTLTARRAFLWPFAINWRQPVDVTIEYKTDIVTSRSGREQRRRLRATPRKNFTFTVTLDRTDQRLFDRLLKIWQPRTWLLADPTRHIKTIAAADVGDIVLAVTGLPVWVEVGKNLIVNGDTIVGVDDIDNTTNVITLTAPLVNEIPADTLIRPALSGLMNGQVLASRPTSGALEARINLDVTPGSEPADDGVPGAGVLDGREVLLNKPNWLNGVKDGYNWPVELVDYGQGRNAGFTPIAFGTLIRQAEFVAQSSDEAQDIEQFFRRCSGRAGEFLMPSWINDLEAKFDLEQDTDFIRLNGTETYDAFHADTVYRAIAVILKDGTRIYRKIQSIVIQDDSDGRDAVIHCSANWHSDIAVDDIRMICWMPVVRFAADALTTQWLTEGVAQIAFNMQTLEHLTAENPIPDTMGAP